MLRSKRPFIAVLSGMIVCFLITYITKVTCWAPIFGILVTVYFGKVSTPKEGAFLGALVPVPAVIYYTFPIFSHNYQEALNTGSPLGMIIAGIVGIIFIILVGAFYGFVCGKIMQFMRKNEGIII